MTVIFDLKEFYCTIRPSTSDRRGKTENTFGDIKVCPNGQTAEAKRVSPCATFPADPISEKVLSPTGLAHRPSTSWRSAWEGFRYGFKGIPDDNGGETGVARERHASPLAWASRSPTGKPMTPRNAQEEAMSHVALLGTRSLLRSGLVSLLGSLGFERVDEAATLDALIAQTHGDIRPDIVLINVSNGVDAARLVFDIRSWAPEAKVVFLFSDLDVRTLVGCFSAGASGYLLESLSGEALQKSLTLISAGEKVFPSELAGVISDLAGKREMASNPTDLQNIEFTPREIWILRLLADGRSNKMIASSLNISRVDRETSLAQHLAQAAGQQSHPGGAMGIGTGARPRQCRYAGRRRRQIIVRYAPRPPPGYRRRLAVICAGKGPARFPIAVPARSRTPRRRTPPKPARRPSLGSSCSARPRSENPRCR